MHEEENKTHFHFQRDIAILLMKTSEHREWSTGGKHADLRFDRIDHDAVACKQGRCVVCKKCVLNAISALIIK